MDYSHLSRKELQQLAKENGIKANLSNKAIIDELLALQSKDNAQLTENSKGLIESEEILPFSSLNRPQMLQNKPTDSMDSMLVIEEVLPSQKSFEVDDIVEVNIDDSWVEAIVMKVNKMSYRVNLTTANKVVTVKNHEVRSPHLETTELHPEKSTTNDDESSEVIRDQQIILAENSSVAEHIENSIEQIQQLDHNEVETSDELPKQENQHVDHNEVEPSEELPKEENEDIEDEDHEIKEDGEDIVARFNEITEMIESEQPLISIDSSSNPFDEFQILQELEKEENIIAKKLDSKATHESGKKDRNSLVATSTTPSKSSVLARKSFANTPSSASKPCRVVPKSTTAQRLRMELLAKNRARDSMANKQSQGRQATMNSKRSSTIEPNSTIKSAKSSDNTSSLSTPQVTSAHPLPATSVHRVNSTAKPVGAKTPSTTSALPSQRTPSSVHSTLKTKKLTKEKTVTFSENSNKLKFDMLKTTAEEQKEISKAGNDAQLTQKPRTSTPNFSKSHANLFSKSKSLTSFVKKDETLLKKMEDAFTNEFGHFHLEKENIAQSNEVKPKSQDVAKTKAPRVHPKDVASRKSLASTHSASLTKLKDAKSARDQEIAAKRKMKA